MRDLLADYDRLSARGPVGRAVVTNVWGSAPRLAGASMLATADGQMAGSVSGGCVESAVVEAIGTAIRTGQARIERFVVSHEQAWAVGLACGGSIELLVEPELRSDLLAAARSEGGAVVPSVVGGPFPLGRPALALADPIARAMPEVLAGQVSRTLVLSTPAGDASVFFELYPAPERLLIIGAVHVAEVLARLARPLGYRVIVADGRAAFLTRERFPEADVLLEAWPAEAFAQVGVDEATSICVLSHDPKFDEPALELALRSPARYIGAIGSRRTQAERRDRLRAAGFSDADVARIHGPIGLDLGGRHPGEIALAILAEMTATKYGRT
jgi:xanthine dehydrogenase accessory factor